MCVVSKTSKRIFLVEDNPGDVRLMLEAFGKSRRGNRIDVATNGAEALARLRGKGRNGKPFRPALIVLDLNLPRKDGREVLREIKEDPELRTIPVVVFSSSRAEEDMASAYRLRANCYITKPADVDEFIRIMQSVKRFWLNTARLSCTG